MSAGSGAAPRILVAGIGNIFASDDGFGCEVARRLTTQPVPVGVVVTDFGIRGMHLAYELLEGWDGLVLIDALPRGNAPGDLVVLSITQDDIGSGDFDAHGMEPTAVLASLGSLGGTLPRTFLIGCEPADVTEGIGLSPPVEAAIDAAVGKALELADRLASEFAAETRETTS